MQTSLDDLALLLGEVALFRDLPGSAVIDMARSTEVVSLPKCRIVYAAGDSPRALYHVMSGHLKVSVSSPEGDEKVIEILSPRDVFGVAELFDDAPCVSAVETVTPVVLMAIGREGVLRAIEHDPGLSRRMLGAMARRQTSIEREIAAECFQSGTAKVVATLLRLAGPDAACGESIMLELAIPKHVLAARLGFTPETLSRIFRELSDAGMIHVHGKQVTLTAAFIRCHGAGDSRSSRAGRPAGRPSGRSAAPWFERGEGASRGGASQRI